MGSDSFEDSEEIDRFTWYLNCAIAGITFTFSALMLACTRPYGAWIFRFLTYTVPNFPIDEHETGNSCELSKNQPLQEALIIRHYGAIYMAVALTLLHGLFFPNRNSFQFVQFTAFVYLLNELLADVLSGHWGTARCSFFLLLLIPYLGRQFYVMLQAKQSWRGVRRRLSLKWPLWRSEGSLSDSTNSPASINITRPNDSPQHLSLSENESMD